VHTASPLGALAAVRYTNLRFTYLHDAVTIMCRIVSETFWFWFDVNQLICNADIC